MATLDIKEGPFSDRLRIHRVYILSDEHGGRAPKNRSGVPAAAAKAAVAVAEAAREMKDGLKECLPVGDVNV